MVNADGGCDFDIILDMKITMEYRVPYADTDQMGVVYYGNYLTIFERARNELMRAGGYTYMRCYSEEK